MCVGRSTPDLTALAERVCVVARCIQALLTGNWAQKGASTVSRSDGTNKESVTGGKNITDHSEWSKASLRPSCRQNRVVGQILPWGNCLLLGKHVAPQFPKHISSHFAYNEPQARLQGNDIQSSAYTPSTSTTAVILLILPLNGSSMQQLHIGCGQFVSAADTL